MPYSDRLHVDGYVFDSLMPDLVGHDRRASAFVVYLYLWRRTRGGTRPAVVSHSAMADGTGLSKRSVQEAFRHLQRRALVETRRATPTSAPAVRLSCDWRR
jgi:hypothetical protein